MKLQDILKDLEKLDPDSALIKPVSTPTRDTHVEYFAQQIGANHEIYYNPEDWTLPVYKGGVNGI